MSLENNYQNFTSGNLPKAEFIRKNYEETHCRLFELASFLHKTDISNIEIKDHQVIMTYRKNGMRLLCEVNEFRTAPIETINFLHYEEEEVFVFNELLRNKKLLFDIGGNIGFYAVFAATTHPKLCIETFEPVPKMFSTLSKNIEINSLQSRVKAINMGFSDSEGNVSFYVYPFGGTNASMINVSDSIDAKEVISRVVKLDDYLQSKNQYPDIIKCDVEGAEKLVLMGGLESIKKAKPVLFFELLRKWSAKYNYHPNDVLGKLREFGYECFVPLRGKLKLFSLVNDDTMETNFFFLHKNAHKHHISDLVIL